ncbi:MAG: hypothetical protein HY204_02525 [Nitrospirae bacterium]|nr:hypothetical protein [Nitrospirota bacterium]
MKAFQVRLGQFAVLLLTAVISISCSGGGSSHTTASGGVVGKITGFGSVFVNGVEFDTTGTTITKDGDAAAQDDLAIGMVVTVHGTFNADGTTGSASSIEYKDDLEGVIQDINAPNLTLTVMSQKVVADAATRYENVGDFSGLNVGNVIEVSGFVNADGSIQATFIELKAPQHISGTEIELKGKITSLDPLAMTFLIGDQKVDYSHATLEPTGLVLADGLYVEVKSTTGIDSAGALTASKVKAEDNSVGGSEGDELKIEGYVTRYVSATDFDINGQPVATTSLTTFKDGTAAMIGLNVLLEAEGTLDADGVLIAREISFE